MKLYKEVLIESAEQAEALPIGTVAVGPNHYAATRIEYGLGWSVTGDASSDYHDHIIGWTALLPIEAEEETRIDPEVFNELDARLAYTQAAYALPPGELQMRHQTRHTTPWCVQQ